MEIKGFIPTSLVDWDGKVSAVIFLPGCSFKCSFCSNKELVLFPEKLKTVDFEEIVQKIEASRQFIDGVVITGGEPTIHESLPQLCQKLREMGFKIKLDTNGSNPKMLERLFQQKLIDYVAMDIKTSFEKYKEIVNCSVDLENIKKSIELIGKLPDYEFRTTCVPKIVTQEDLLKIAEYLKSIGANKKFFLQQFRNDECLSEKFEAIKPYSKEEMQGFYELIKNSFEKCGLRNI